MSSNKVDRFVRVRPYLWHLTSRANEGGIRRGNCLESAAVTLRAAGRVIDVARRRATQVLVDGPNGQVSLRDQAPLYEGNVAFADGWDFPRLVKHLNDFVFFWPGSAERPIDYGVRHFERYKNEPTAILRVPTASLLASNASADIRVSRYNSGSPRCSGGLKSPRGPDTFKPVGDFTGVTSEVIELVVRDRVTLPDDAEWLH